MVRKGRERDVARKVGPPGEFGAPAGIGMHPAHQPAVSQPDRCRISAWPKAKKGARLCRRHLLAGPDLPTAAEQPPANPEQPDEQEKLQHAGSLVSPPNSAAMSSRSSARAATWLIDGSPSCAKSRSVSPLGNSSR